MSDPWVIVPTPNKSGYYSLVRGYGNATEWFNDGPYGTATSPAAWAFLDLVEEVRQNLINKENARTL